MANVSILGAGYVGLCTGTLLAELDHRVTLVDIDPDKITQIQQGQAPFHEPGLNDALTPLIEDDKLHATTDTTQAIHDTQLTFLCVGTPQDEDGGANLDALETAARDTGKALTQTRDAHIVVTKSTVPPGTTDTLIQPTILDTLPPDDQDRVTFAANPEFLREGSALNDARNPDKIVLGSHNEDTLNTLEDLYQDLKAPIVKTDPATAELIKYANNAFLATKITFANEMANLAETVGADWQHVAHALGLDDRISPKFFRAGAGFGGSCFPKDVAALAHHANQHDTPSHLLETVLTVNETQPLRVIDLLEDELGTLQGKRVALLGLAFKPGTDDVRQTRAAPIHDALTDHGATILCHDPQANDTFTQLRPNAQTTDTPHDALTDADACILQTAWPEYQRLTPADFKTTMRTPILIDARRAYNAETMRNAGIQYRAIGLAPES